MERDARTNGGGSGGRSGNGRGGFGGPAGGAGSGAVGGPGAADAGTDSPVGLVGRLIDDVSSLFRNEVALARAEFSQAATQAKAGLGSVAIGGAVLLVGVQALVAAAIIGLANVVDWWLAALIVGAVVTIVGAVLLQGGKKKLEPANFRLERTQESLRRDKEAVTTTRSVQ
jgi:hypothetical protein